VSGGVREQRLEPNLVRFGKGIENILANNISLQDIPLFREGATNAEANPPVTRANVRIDRFKAIMSAGPSALFDFDLAGEKVEVVVKNGNLMGAELVKIKRLTDRLSREVHKCLWFE
jgi:hypothetical protein